MEDLLSKEQVKYIHSILEKECKEGVCISRSNLFDMVEPEMNLTIEQYQFEQFLTYAIKNNMFPGFRTRAGRNGGICRGNAQERCIVSVRNGESIARARTQMTEKRIVNLLTSIFEAKAITDEVGDIIVNNKHFKLDNATSAEQIFINLIDKA